MIAAVVLAFVAGLYLGVLISHLRELRDEGTRPRGAIQQQQTRIFSDLSGGHSILDANRNSGSFFDQDDPNLVGMVKRA